MPTISFKDLNEPSLLVMLIPRSDIAFAMVSEGLTRLASTVRSAVPA